VSALAFSPERHPVRWVTAAPLWSSLVAIDDPSAKDLARMQRPALLRLTSDDFMEELATLLADDPAKLRDLEATPKSYRAAPPGADDSYEPPIDQVKLYQPAHGHFNLVAATLVCRIAGMPDREVDAGADESVGFVLRRVTGEKGEDELAWDGNGWIEAEAPDTPASGEHVVPMFPLAYRSGDRARRLFVGLLPTSSIESFKSAGTVSLSPQPGDRTGDPPDRRLEELDERVIEPLLSLAEATIPAGLSPAEQQAFVATEVEASRFILLDLGDFLLRHAPQLWSAVQNRRAPSPSGLSEAYELLRDTWADLDVDASWLDALLGVWGERDRIWGDVDEEPTYEVNLKRGATTAAVLRENAAELRQKLRLALPERTAEQKEEPQPPFEAPKLDPRPTTQYVVRCVYRRPKCGPLRPDIVSDPSERFAIAGFFDLDAPARPLHISLPIDTSIAGLRKAPKNVSVLISRELRQQLGRLADPKKALKGEASSAEPVDLGLICSLSIPIITICAFVILMIILALLNFVFWWLSFFRICFPVPVKAKG
jgi:hypothetical protein